MALEDRVKELEEELKVLKNEIQTTLLDIQEQILSHYYPSLYPSANKEANLAQQSGARQAAEAAAAAHSVPAPFTTSPINAANNLGAAPAQANAPVQASTPPQPSYHGKYKTQTITLVEEPDEEEQEEAEPVKEEPTPMRMAVVPKTTHKKPNTAANGHAPTHKLPEPPAPEKLTPEDEAFLDAIVSAKKVELAPTTVSFDEFKDLVQKKTPESTAEEELFTEELLDELLRDSFTEMEEEQLSVTGLLVPFQEELERSQDTNPVNNQSVKSTVRKLLNWVDESVGVIGKDPTKQAIAMYVRAGDLSGDMREALMRLVDSSHVEPATEKAGIRQIIDTLGELNDILDHHSVEDLNLVMEFITEVNFG